MLVIDEFRKNFELKENPKPKKSARRLLRDKKSGSYEGQVGQIKDKSMDSVGSTSGVKVETIGDLTAVQDFEAMISRRDSPEWVSKAIFGMKNKVFEILENSNEGEHYSKALECLVALRKGCVIEQEPKQFNNFLRDVYRFCEEKNLKSFCEFLGLKDVTFITKTEAEDSDVAEKDARSLFVKAKS